MNVHVHIERLVVDPGLNIKGPELEAAVAEALQAMLATSGGSLAPINAASQPVGHLKGQWPSGQPQASAIGTALSSVIHGSVFHGGSHGHP